MVADAAYSKTPILFALCIYCDPYIFYANITIDDSFDLLRSVQL